MFRWLRKYDWWQFTKIVAGFDFNDPIMTDGDKPTRKVVRIFEAPCKVYKTTTASSLFWEKGDPVWPVYYAVGKSGVFYDNKTVAKFWKYITSKPIEDILSYYETPD